MIRSVSKHEPGGANCATGGKWIDVGLDDDRDGTLDPADIETVTNGGCQTGRGSRLWVALLPFGLACSRRRRAM